MTSERFMEIACIDQRTAEKLGVIDESLLRLELDYAHAICRLADEVDLDRRIAFISSIRIMEELWEEMIMAL